MLLSLESHLVTQRRAMLRSQKPAQGSLKLYSFEWARRVESECLVPE